MISSLLLIYSALSPINNVSTTLDWTKGYPDSELRFVKDILMLDTAREGQEISISVRQGGYQTSAESLIKALKRTKAKTVMEIDGWGASYGAVMPMYGREIHLENTDILYFHGCWVGSETSYGYLDVGCTNYAIAGFRKELFDARAIDAIYSKERPWISFTGPKICEILKHRIIKKDSTSCTIKGFK